ncbi:MAG: type 4a pilus biogenesis protein PilO [Nitrospiraceae bacterium]|nr:type 4a pilus biogenesis protein PilO [Nitrospiraceae bacterium]
MALKFDMKSLPPYVRIIMAALPAALLAVAVMILLIMPKQKEIKALEARIDEQNNKIASSQAKAARLEALIKESEQLQKRVKELHELLPADKEITSLLKQISDLATASGLDLKSWRPGQKKEHPSGIVAETPVSISVSGAFHDLGRFLSSLTKLNRIVNVDNIQTGGAQAVRGVNTLAVTFTATAYSLVVPEEAGKK